LFNRLSETDTGLLSLPLEFAERWINALHDRGPRDSYQLFG
jgi:hypothetical protein